MEKKQVNFREILDSALKNPGQLKQVYSLNFWDYSFGNCMIVAGECAARELPLGPIATYKGWQAKGRQVKKGEKAIALCMPVTMKRTEEKNGETKDHVWQAFCFKPFWFVLSQTEGKEQPIHTTPEWNLDRALSSLKIERVPFSSFRGNTGGYAETIETAEGVKVDRIALNPLNDAPTATLYHELGHIVLGHTREKYSEKPQTGRALRELEAELVALFCLEALGLPGAEYCRGKIQAEGTEITDKVARRVFKACDTILRAGLPVEQKEKLAA